MVQPLSARALAAAALSLGLAFGATACSEPQTLKPYTPAEGVNAEVQASSGRVPLKVRNLLIMSKKDGEGTLVGAILSPEADTLATVNGQLLTVQGDPGDRLGPVDANVELQANEMVNLLDKQAVSLQASGLTAGRTADLVLTFKNAGPLTIRVPVVDGNKADYKTASPKAASGSASPSASPTP